MSFYKFIEREKANHGVSVLCSGLGVSASGYYEWRGRSQSRRLNEDRVLCEAIRRSFGASEKRYGARRIRADLRDDGIRSSRRRIRRLMRQMNIVAITRAKNRAAPRPLFPPRDLVKGNWSPVRPNALWVSDITQIRTLEGWIYLAVVIDVFSRKVVGYAMAPNSRAALVKDAFQMASDARAPQQELIFHSDRGQQFVSLEHFCWAHTRRTRTSYAGRCQDNAVAESFFSTIKRELTEQTRFGTRIEAELAIFAYIEGFYNPRRRHSSINHKSPNQFEREHEESHSK